TAAGGSTVAYNPYPASEVSVAIFLPTDLENDTQMAADYLVWVQDEDIASLLTWDGSQWVEVVGDWSYVFDANLATPQTVLYLPFDTLGISNPVTQSLGLVALASEDDGLKLWAAMPSYNNLNSETVIGSSASSDVEVFTLLKAYEWDSLGADICPSAGSGDTIQFNGADLQATISAEPSGVGYGLFSHHLIFAHRYLFPGAADWAGAATQLCSGNPLLAKLVSDPLPLPSFCQREPVGSATDFVNPRRVLGPILSTELAPVVDGQTVSYTIRVTNDGITTAQDVTVTLVADKLLTLAGGPLELTFPIGSLAPGETEELVVEGTVDTGVNPGQGDGWTHLKAIVFDESGDRYHPAEELHLNHETDQAGPDYVE
ncbi:MAG: hypothetical protein GY835_09455, partial [bacterium]|nr:hypothetical protein [bacterium]